MIQVLDEARDAADQGRRGAQGMLTTSKAEVKTLKRELKDYTKLKVRFLMGTLDHES